MVELLKCGIMLVVFILIFYVMGCIISNLMKYETEFLETVYLGFFSYFALFQCIALPLIFMKKRLSVLTVFWGVILSFVGIAYFFLLYLNRKKQTKQQGIVQQTISCVKSGLKNPYLIIFAILVVFVCYFVAIQNLWGWDTAYYIGTISTAVNTDTMYQFGGESGKAFREIPFRYALSTFYMNSAVFCKISGITPVFFQRYVMGTLCVLLYFITLYLSGKELFKGQAEKTFLFGIVAGILNFFFVSEYTTSQFLLFRNYEAKAYCANVIIPGVFLIILRLHKQSENKEYWKVLFLMGLASVPISMSAILIVPLMIVIAILAEALVTKNIKIIRYGFLCMIPNGVYLIIYLLNTLNLFVIKV